MCWRTLAYRVALSSATPWPAHPSQRRMNKRPPRRLHTRPLPLRCRCCTLLCVRALSSLCCHAEPSPPSLPPCVGPRCPHAMCGYKRRPLPFVCPCPHPCLPTVSHLGRASPLFLPLCRCQATSRAFRPRVQVSEHPPTSENLLQAWPTSPTTGAARHRRRAPVRSATASPSYSDTLPLPFLTGPVRGIVTIPWGSTFSSSGRWALAVGRTTVEHCARTAGCRASRERSHVRTRMPSGHCARASLTGLWAARAGHRSTLGRPRAT
jgi:hypothetical protein